MENYLQMLPRDLTQVIKELATPQLWVWTYQNDPHMYKLTRSVLIEADTEEEAIWKLLQHVIKTCGTHLPRNCYENNSYGIGFLFHQDIYHGEFDGYNLDKATKENFVPEFKKRIAEESEHYTFVFRKVTDSGTDVIR